MPQILTAIIGGAEQRDQLSFGEKFVTVFDYLMRPANQIEIVLVQKFADHFGAECETDASVVLTPTHLILVGIGPQQIAEEALIWDVGGPHDPPDLLHRLQIGTET